MWRRIALPALVLLTVVQAVAQENGSITAEALGQANLRAAAALEATLLGEIRQGQRWPVLARSEFYPWLLLGDAGGQPLGWVYADLVTLNGDSAALPVSTLVLTPAVVATTPAATGATVAVTATPASGTPGPAAAVHGVLAGVVNIRQGPGIDHARVAVGQAGDRFRLTARHSLLPWVQVAEPRAPNGRAWIARDLLQIEGDLFSLPVVSQTALHLPTLTPTPSLVRVTAAGDAGGERRALPPGLVEAAQQAWDLVLQAGFERESGRPAALAILDLASGAGIGFQEQLAFSGTSIQKINVLVTLLGALDGPLTRDLAVDVANTMICSENVATNRLLARIGAGDVWAGAAAVTRLLATLEHSGSFITAPYTIPGQTPAPPVAPLVYPTPVARDAVPAADPWNRITAGDVARQLAALYRCAREEDSPLFSAGLEPRECRQALMVMSNNTVDALLRAGVPQGTVVAHKHGWIADTHSNAALFNTPGGDYVVVLLLHQPQWLNFQLSLPLMAEISRLLYNHYNPQNALPAIRAGTIPEAGSCNFSASPLIEELLLTP